MYIPRKSPPFNPFVVLSDITISTIVILVVLLMLFTGLLSAEVASKDIRIKQYETAENEHRREIEAVQRTQAEISGPLDKQRWTDPNAAVLQSRGLDRTLVRFPHLDKYFQLDVKSKSQQLTPMGRTHFSEFARFIQPILLKYQDEVKDYGCIIEVQIQGYTSKTSHDDFKRSLERARLVHDVIAGRAGFPKHLLSLAAYGSSRPAYESSESVGKKLYGQDIVPTPRVLSKIPKQRYDDRIDIILMFAGHVDENDYVRSVDANDASVLHGPVNDVSNPRVDQAKANQGYKDMLKPSGKLPK